MKKPKKKPARRAVKKDNKRTGRSVEISAVLLLFLALFSLISLISYNPNDPSFANVPPPGTKAQNFAGRVGATYAEALLQFLGYGAFFLTVACGYLAARVLLTSGPERLRKPLGSTLLLMLILCPFLALIIHNVPLKGREIPAGGILGVFLFDVLERYFNTIGAFILLLAGFVLFLLFSTRLSLGKTALFFKGLFTSTFKDVRIKIVRYQENKIREKMREKIRTKYQAREGPEAAQAADRERGKEKKKMLRERKKKRAEGPPAVLPPQPTVKPRPRPAEQQPLLPDLGKKGDYRFPPFNLLEPGKPSEKLDKDELFHKKKLIEEKLREFDIDGEVREYHPGPVITTFEYFPAPGIKVSQVAGKTEELSLALAAESVRIQRIPGKSSLGIEIPNNKRETIKLRDIIQSEKFMESPSKLAFALGKDVHGGVYITDLTIMPHLLIAGSTGTGKSVALNALIASILYKATPEEVKILLIDPKRLEFSLFEDIPHLFCPVINDPKKAHVVLLDIVRKMEERYKKLQTIKVRNIEQYNQQVSHFVLEKKGQLSEEEKKEYQPLPYIVIIIDELAELMMAGAQEVEFFILRLAQLARAVGIHLVMATQRPSIDVITGTVKNNFSCRIAFRVPSRVDSKVILDGMGAEKLLGMGDMLFLPPNFPRLVRLHCSFISIPEVKRLVKFVKQYGPPVYDERLVQAVRDKADKTLEELGEKDELYDKAVEIIMTTGQASASYLQRKMKLGYARAARIIDQMESEGLLGPSEGSKPREILVDRKHYLKEIIGREGERGEDS